MISGAILGTFVDYIEEWSVGYRRTGQICPKITGGDR